MMLLLLEFSESIPADDDSASYCDSDRGRYLGCKERNVNIQRPLPVCPRVIVLSPCSIPDEKRRGSVCNAVSTAPSASTCLHTDLDVIFGEYARELVPHPEHRLPVAIARRGRKQAERHVGELCAVSAG